VVLAGDLNTNAAKAGFNPHFKGMRDVSGKKGLDRMFISNSLAGGNARRIRKLSSDHPALVNHIKIPGLSEGGFTLNEGIARLHKKETVLTAPLSEKLNIGIDRLASGGGNTYNIYMPEMENREAVARYVMRRIESETQRRPGSRRIGN
jgi:hypothetical protein